MMSLLAMPTPSKSTDFTIYVYWRDKKDDSNVLYKNQNIILYTTKTQV